MYICYIVSLDVSLPDSRNHITRIPSGFRSRSIPLLPSHRLAAAARPSVHGGNSSELGDLLVGGVGSIGTAGNDIVVIICCSRLEIMDHAQKRKEGNRWRLFGYLYSLLSSGVAYYCPPCNLCSSIQLRPTDVLYIPPYLTYLLLELLCAVDVLL